MKNEILLSINNLKWFSAGNKILDIPEFKIQKNEVTALIGPNGAGKSSLLKVLALLQKPDSGEIYYNGAPVASNSLATRRKITMVFQEPLLMSGSVYKNVAQGLHYRGLDRDETDRRVKYWLDSFGIAHLAGRNQKFLSGGEAQRVSLARALAIEPEILFLDEPFAALDQPTRLALAEDIGRVIRSRGISAVFVTHSAEELSLFTDRICVMDKGSLVQEGSPDDIFNKPINEMTASLVGIENILAGIIQKSRDGIQTVEIDRIPVIINNIDSSPGTMVKLFIRPENILPVEHAPCNKFYGTIEKVVSLSSQYKLIINCGFMLTVLVSKGVFSMEQVRPGKNMSVYLPPEKIHIVNIK